MVNTPNNYLSRIPSDWLKTKGKNVNIGIMDTGCNLEHESLKHAIREYKSFGAITDSHGTHVTGIIVSKNDNIHSTKGLASSSNVYIAGVAKRSARGYEAIYEAFQWLISKDIQVMNLSCAYISDVESLKELLGELSKNALICCAYSPTLPYPHSYDEVVSVGMESNWNDVDIVTNGEYVSTLGKGYKKMIGTSMATAFVSSVACLAKSYDKNIGKEEFLTFVKGKEKLKTDLMKNVIHPYSDQVNIRFD